MEGEKKAGRIRRKRKMKKKRIKEEKLKSLEVGRTRIQQE